MIERPVLRYHGGKYRLADFVISHFPSHEIYVEPFGGAGSVLMKKPRCKAEVYNDLDGEIVNLFQVMRDNGPALIRKLRFTPYARAEFYKAYEPCEDPLERARRQIVRAYMGFNAAAATRATRVGFRSDTKRKYTTSSNDWENYPRAAIAMVKRLRGVVIENEHALKIIQKQDSHETLFYCDPPYTLDQRYKGQRTKIYRHEMTDKDHEELLQALLACRGAVVLSGYENPLYMKTLRDWSVSKAVAIASAGKGAKKAEECLWLNPKAAAALMRERDTLFYGL